MNNEIPIFFSIDDKYAPFLAVALTSAIKNSDANKNYKAIVLYNELNDDNICRIKKLEKNNFKIELIPMKSGFEIIKNSSGNKLRCDYFTLTIFFRLFIPNMFPQYDKGIYIDSDVVVTSDIAKMFEIDLKDNLLGGCRDLSIADVKPLIDYVENAVGVDGERYINSGVLLMNLKKLREENFEAHFLNLLNTYQFDNIAPDQDYINAICKDRILYIDKLWNVMPNDSRPEEDKTNLIHYNLFSKPWCYDNVQYADEFWNYAKDSGYYEEIVDYKNSYSDDAKHSDEQCLQTLIKRGMEIPDLDVTFKKMSRKGVKIRL